MRPSRIGLALVLAIAGAGVLMPAGAPPADAQSITIFEDGFESGDLSNWDNVDTRRYWVTSDPLRVHSGTYALEGQIDASVGWGEINKWFLPGYDDVTVRFDVMFEHGFMNLRGDGNGMHFASVMGNRIDDKWSAHGTAGITPDGTDFFVTTLDPAHRHGDPALQPFTFYSYFPDMVPPWGNVFRQTEPALPIVPGRWHEVVIYVDAGTPGQYNGSQRLWFDGTKKIEVLDMRWRDTNDLRINEFAIVNYMPGTPQTQRIWIDNVQISTGPPNRDPGPTIDASLGLVDPTTGTWHVRQVDGTLDSFVFGNPGDVPFVGDWDCDGVETPGLYRRSDGFVYLRNSNTQGTADIEYFFGNPDDLPLAGDFNGDGCDTVSIYRPSEGRVYVIDRLGDGAGGLGRAEHAYFFGNPGDKPFVGDFDGDDRDTVGLHRESTGFLYFRNSHTQGVADVAFFYGNPGDRMVAADWNGDGAEAVGIYRPTTTRFYLRFTNTQGNADAELNWGETTWLPIAGNMEP